MQCDLNQKPLRCLDVSLVPVDAGLVVVEAHTPIDILAIPKSGKLKPRAGLSRSRKTRGATQVGPADGYHVVRKIERIGARMNALILKIDAGGVFDLINHFLQQFNKSSFICMKRVCVAGVVLP